MVKKDGLIDYLFGVYVDSDGTRLLQVVNNVDGFSCELLANQFGNKCFIRPCCATVKDMIDMAKFYARNLKCKYIEVNCVRGAGYYKLLRVTKTRSVR